MTYIPGGGGGGDMNKATYDPDLDNVVDVAESAPWAGLTGVPATFPPSAHSHAEADVTGLVADLAGKAALVHTHAAADVTSGQFAIARLASGAPDGTKFIRDDGVLATPPGGSGLSEAQVLARLAVGL